MVKPFMNVTEVGVGGMSVDKLTSLCVCHYVQMVKPFMNVTEVGVMLVDKLTSLTVCPDCQGHERD